MLDYLRNLLQVDATATPTTPIHDAAVERNVDFELGDFAIDDYKPMKIIAIGAGMSGILASIRFRQYIHNLTLTIYEKEDRIGGTWHVNRYPGVACDVPSHSYQYSFENKSDWSAVYSPGSEILEHMESIVAKYKLEPYIKLRHELTHALYDEATAKWHVRLKRPSSTAEGQFEEFEDEADFLFMGVGILSRWNWPDVEGLHEFKGTLVHSADWNLGGATWEDDVKDWGEKSVAVIGLGSSALQIASALQDKVGRLTQYARGRTWVVPPFFQEKVSAGIGNKAVEGDENYKFTKEDIKVLEDPAKFTDLRRAVDTELCNAHLLGIRDSEAQMEAQERNRVHMTTALASAPEIAEKLIPDFSVSCRRLTPAPGYLKGLAERKIRLVGTDIKRVTQDAIETTDGVATKHDVIICATGFDVSYRFPFALIGRGGVNLTEKWTPHPETYLSVCTDGFPNCFFASGPNSCTATGALMPMLEHQVGYAVHAARKMQRERLRSMEVKREAVLDFDDYVENYFPKTVFAEKVRTWYKMGKTEGRVVGLWPGSTLHCLLSLRHPRWEDFEYEYEQAGSNGPDGTGKRTNRLYWLGNGMTLNEMTGSGNRAWFLDDNYVDVPPVPA